mmetsp:Transcript_9798/g.14172  ORF Transcript_9798/g.14172 Transcript_9798/m.14172 type:complete len:138 (-) Transcript_9798:41-454(-)
MKIERGYCARATGHKIIAGRNSCSYVSFFESQKGMSTQDIVDVGSEVLVCGGSYPGAFGVITRKTPKRYEIRRTDGTTIQVAQHNVKQANKPATPSWRTETLEERVERQMETVQREVGELSNLMKALSIERRLRKKK